MKVGFFTDSHYSSAKVTCDVRYNSLSLGKIRRAYAEFCRCGCELVVFLGDLTDTEEAHDKEIENIREIRAVIEASGIPTMVVMGNHDAVAFTQEEFYDVLGEGCRPRNIDCGDTHILFLDACYYYTSGLHYAPHVEGTWMDTYYPFVEELKETLTALEGDVYICMHQNIDPTISEDHCLHNDAMLRRVLEDSGKVRCVYQGHYHDGSEHREGEIRYKTFPAMCQNDQAWFVEEL